MVDTLNLQELGLNEIILRQIWARRNSLIFEDKFESPSALLQKSRALLEDFQQAQITTSSCSHNQEGNHGDKARTWQPPTLN